MLLALHSNIDKQPLSYCLCSFISVYGILCPAANPSDYSNPVIMARSAVSKLALVCLVSSTVPSASALVTAVNAARAVGLLPRDSGTSLQACGKGLPSEFSCPSDTVCLALNNTNTVSAICCPKGSSCNLIQPVNCDIRLQNATAHPGAALQTTNLTANLPTCEGSCCPFGYICQDGNNCAILPSTSSAPTSASSSASATLSTRSSGAPSPSSTNKNATITLSPLPSQSSFPARAILAGLLPGLVLGLLLTLLVFFLLRRHRAAKAAKRDTIDFGSVDRTISDPIYHSQEQGRTDFLYNSSQQPPASNAHINDAAPTLPSVAFPPDEATLASPYPPTTATQNPKARAAAPPQAYITPTRAPRAPHSTGRMSSTWALTARRSIPNVRTLFHRSSVSARDGREGSNPRDTLAGTGSQETIDVLMPGEGPPATPPDVALARQSLYPSTSMVQEPWMVERRREQQRMRELLQREREMRAAEEAGLGSPFRGTGANGSGDVGGTATIGPSGPRLSAVGVPCRPERMTTFSRLMDDAGYEREGMWAVPQGGDGRWRRG